RVTGAIDGHAGRHDLRAGDVDRPAGQGHRLAVVGAHEDLAGLERLHDDPGRGAVQDGRGDAVRHHDVALGRAQAADGSRDGLVLVGIGWRLGPVLAIGRTWRLDAHHRFLLVLLAVVRLR